VWRQRTLLSVVQPTQAKSGSGGGVGGDGVGTGVGGSSLHVLSSHVEHWQLENGVAETHSRPSHGLPSAEYLLQAEGGAV
jgi:hypothetical protein